MVINYKSDFDFVLRLYDCAGHDIGFPPYDWEARFWTLSKERAYVASCRGGVCVNCGEDCGAIHVVFDNHGLEPGPLKVEFEIDLPNGCFPDGGEAIVTPASLDVVLVRQATPCPSKAEVEMILPFIKGEPFRYEDFTEEQLADLRRPAVEAAGIAEAAANEAVDAAGEAREAAGDVRRLSSEIDAAEAERRQAEAQREDKESDRQYNEQQRIARETERMAAEQARVEAEQFRQSAYGGLLKVDDANATFQTKTEAKDAERRLSDEIDAKEDAFTPGFGLAMSEGRELSVTLDTRLFKVVSELPDRPDPADEGKIFLVPAERTAEEDIYAEYLWDGARWEKFGEVVPDVDLSGYYTSVQVDGLLAKKANAEDIPPIYKGKGSLSVIISAKSSNSAEGNYSLATGRDTEAYGDYSFSGGIETDASGESSVALGNSTEAYNESELASGKYNKKATASSKFGDAGNTLLTVGNGSDTGNRHNAFEVRQNGDIYIPDTNAGGEYYAKPMLRLQGELKDIKDSQSADLTKITELAGKLNGVENVQAALDDKISNGSAFNIVITPGGTLPAQERTGALEFADGDGISISKASGGSSAKIVIGVNPETLPDLGYAKPFTIGHGLEMSPERELSVSLDVNVFKVVDALPSAPESADQNKIFLVPDPSGTGNNAYKEYVYVKGAWELFGEYKSDVDLTPYLRKADAAQTYATKNELDVVETLAESVNKGLGETIQRVDTLETSLQADKTNLANFKKAVESDYVKDVDYNKDKESLAGEIMKKAAKTYVDAQDTSTLSAAKSYADTKIAETMAATPELLDTLTQIADRLKDDQDLAGVLMQQFTELGQRIAALEELSQRAIYFDITE